MKRGIVGGLAVSASLIAAAPLSTVNAADLAYKAPPPPVCIWCGWYIGVNGGDGVSQQRPVTLVGTGIINIPIIAPITTPAAGTFNSLGPHGPFGGGQIGYNWQPGGGPWVWGVEADLQGAGIKDSSNGSLPLSFAGLGLLPGLPLGAGATVTATDQLKWFGTARARLGWAAGSLLLYATGGYAVGGVSYSLNYLDVLGGTGAASLSQTRSGYSVGGGIEYEFLPHWTMKGEYQYINLGSATLPATATGAVAVPGILPVAVPYSLTGTSTMRFDYHTIRVGINYHFGYGPVYAKD